MTTAGRLDKSVSGLFSGENFPADTRAWQENEPDTDFWQIPFTISMCEWIRAYKSRALKVSQAFTLPPS